MLRIASGLALALWFAPLLAQDAAPAAVKASAPPAIAGKRVRALPIEGVSTLSRIDTSGALRVGVAVNAPWVMHDKNGELIGYSVDVARKIASDMGWKLELVPTSWPRLLEDLRTNRFDVAISGLSITPQRARLISFSQPYGEYDISVVVNREKVAAADLDALAKDSKLRIAVRKGTLNTDYAHAALPAAQIVEVDDEQQAIADLREGKLDGFVAEAPLPGLLDHLYPQQLHVLPTPLARTAHGLAVRRGDAEFRDVLDAWIIQARTSGWLKARGDYWFNGSDWATQL
jgi:polar amino acid transport system substrate-binding protein